MNVLPISFSALSTFASCPLKYKFTKLNLPKVNNYYAEVGKLVHEYLAFSEFRFNAPLNAIDEAKQIIDNYQRSFKPDQVETKIAFNPKWDEVDFDDPSAMVRGIIDVIVDEGNGEYTIIDYKTNHQINASELQLELYAYMWYKKTNAKKITTRFEYVRLNKSVVKTYDALDLATSGIDEFVMSYITEMQKAQQNDDFQPRLSEKCVYCQYSGMCPLYQQVLSQKGYKTPTDDSELKDLLLKQKLYQAEAKQIKQLIDGYCTIVGDHESDVLEVRHSIANRKYITVHDLAQFYADNPEKLLNFKVSLTNIKDKEDRKALEEKAFSESFERLNIKIKENANETA